MKKLLLVILVVPIWNLAIAQSFSPAFDRFSGGKTSYVNLEDGTQIEGTIDDFDRKKGLIEEVTIKDAEGKKIKLEAEKIKSMYVPPSNLAKFNEAMDFATEASNWQSGNDVDKDIISKGYAMFEKSTVMLGKKKRDLLLQIVNPSFANYVRVYQDPMAKETAGFGVAGIDVVGGEEKSYYVKVGDAPAFRLYKKDYSKQFASVFKGCKAVVDAVGKKKAWSDFASHAMMAAKECQ